MKRLVTTSALALLLAAGGYSRADTDQQTADQSQQSSRYRTNQGDQSQQQQTISGKITGFRHVTSNRNGASGRRSLIRLQLKDGRNYTVDLGPKKNLDRLELQNGDQIRLSGRFANISGRRVFLANRASVDGQTLTIQQPRQSSRSARTASARNGSRSGMLAGTVQGFRYLNVRSSQGRQETHTLANIRLSNGRSTFVDLGPRSRVDRLKLRRGERVRLQTSEGSLDGKRILLADHLSRAKRTDQQVMDEARQRVELNGGQQVTLQGTVQGYQIMSFGTGAQKQVLLRLDLQDGRSVLVDAGQYQQGELDLRDLNLQDRAVIKAHKEGRRLIADEISFHTAQGAASQAQQGKRSEQDADSESQSSGQSAGSSDESTSNNSNQ